MATVRTEFPGNRNASITNLADWRARYAKQRPREGYGHKPAGAASEAAIEQAVRIYCKTQGIAGMDVAAAVACAIKTYRNGHSGATAIQAGYKRADDLAWGDPKGGAA